MTGKRPEAGKLHKRFCVRGAAGSGRKLPEPEGWRVGPGLPPLGTQSAEKNLELGGANIRA